LFSDGDLGWPRFGSQENRGTRHAGENSHDHDEEGGSQRSKVGPPHDEKGGSQHPEDGPPRAQGEGAGEAGTKKATRTTRNDAAPGNLAQ
jgi:hypothetical protein